MKTASALRFVELSTGIIVVGSNCVIRLVYTTNCDTTTKDRKLLCIPFSISRELLRTIFLGIKKSVLII